MVRQIIVTALALAFSACVFVSAADEPAKRSEDPCAGFSDLYDCTRRIEQELIARYPDMVSRRGNELFITLKNGNVISRKDSPEGWDSVRDKDGNLNVAYRFYDFIDPWLIVLGSYWEAAGAEFINPETGKILTVEGWIWFAPDRKYFFARSHPGTSEPEDAILRLSPSGIDLEWKFPDAAGLFDYMWTDSSTIEIRGSADEVLARVHREEGTWKCSGPDEICKADGQNQGR